MVTVKAALPWLLSVLFGSYIRDRLLHAPEADVAALASAANVSVQSWRNVECVQAQYVTEGVTAHLS